MLHPLETEDDFCARFDRREAESEAAQHRNDAAPQSDDDRIGYLYEAIRLARFYIEAGINVDTWLTRICEFEDELGALLASKAS
jgi:hypothetical protein